MVFSELSKDNKNCAKGYLPQLLKDFVWYRYLQTIMLLLRKFKQCKLPLMVVAQLRATLLQVVLFFIRTMVQRVDGGHIQKV